MVVASREFVLDVLIFEEQDGTVFNIISSNHDLYAQYPLSKGAQRAESPMGGWILTPDKENPNRTWCTLLMELDFAGYIPDFVIRTAFRESGYTIAKVRKAMPKFRSKFAHMM